MPPQRRPFRLANGRGGHDGKPTCSPITLVFVGWILILVYAYRNGILVGGYNVVLPTEHDSKPSIDLPTPVITKEKSDPITPVKGEVGEVVVVPEEEDIDISKVSPQYAANMDSSDIHGKTPNLPSHAHTHSLTHTHI